ncbi:P-loop guanosine triphosphatase YjiA [Paenibacillus solanacearum]|uniref:P-loop guanosine triphosphatase YjiA n=1 Tax=Paenibacillus solanacearum TaxID=2048548 RepID=A0A916NXM1_9BACL|nr:GTP-binding protein [Paenibacillus solanacearum]CAG7629474.1 P-loop guanosine triphosphatase YjiA [Paenibacillus solanacearum]
MTSIPVFILSGFLGSGKTTLLLRLVHEAGKRGLQPAILMNELGKLDIDGHMVQSELAGVSVKKLLDGCICCDKKSEVAYAAETLLRQRPDVLFIELTGVANPEEIADCLAEPQLLGRVRLQHIVTVLDAEHVLEYNSLFSADRQLIHTLRRQIEVADLLLLNKVDLIPPTRLRKIEKAVRKHNPKAPMLTAVHSDMDLSLLLAGVEPVPDKHPAGRNPFHVFRHMPSSGQAAEQDGGAAVRHRSFARLSTVVLPCPNPVKPETVERFLQANASRLLRAKGYLNTGAGPSAYLMQYAGKRFSWKQAAYDGERYIVAIGMDLDSERLAKEWLLASADM